MSLNVSSHGQLFITLPLKSTIQNNEHECLLLWTALNVSGRLFPQQGLDVHFSGFEFAAGLHVLSILNDFH